MGRFSLARCRPGQRISLAGGHRGLARPGTAPPPEGACQNSGMGQLDVPVMEQRCEPGEVSAGLRRELIDCWITVSNAGGAAGFPFPPVDEAMVAPGADQLIASLSPGGSRLLLALAGNALAGRG